MSLITCRYDKVNVKLRYSSELLRLNENQILFFMWGNFISSYGILTFKRNNGRKE